MKNESCPTFFVSLYPSDCRYLDISFSVPSKTFPACAVSIPRTLMSTFCHGTVCKTWKYMHNFYNHTFTKRYNSDVFRLNSSSMRLVPEIQDLLYQGWNNRPLDFLSLVTLNIEENIELWFFFASFHHSIPHFHFKELYEKLKR